MSRKPAKTRRRRILYVSNSFSDAVHQRKSLFRALTDGGWSVHLRLPDDDRCAHDLAFPVRTFTFAAKQSFRFRDLVGLVRLALAVLTLRPDVVHARGIKAVLMAGLATSWYRPAALLGHVCGLGRSQGGSSSRLLTTGLRAGISGPRRVLVCQNGQDIEWFKKLIASWTPNLALIRGSGADIIGVQAVPEPAGPLRVVLAARMLRAKGIHTFIEAAAWLRGRVPADTTFVLVGNVVAGDPDSLSAEELREWTAKGVIDWVGWQDDPLAWLASAHVVCLPTTYGEGLPRVLLEACLLGRAIVTSTAPGCDEICRHGLNGLVVPPGDARALGEALRTLLTDAVGRRRMGRLGRILVERAFAETSVIDRFMTLQRRLADGSGRQRAEFRP